MKYIKSVGLISLLTLSMNIFAGEQMSLLECGFPIAGEKFESNLKELLDVSTTPPEIPDYKCEDSYQRYAILCNRIADKETLSDDDPSGLYYSYEKVLASFAKADINKDGDELFIKKISTYINKCSKSILCDSTLVKKEKIDLLKIAVATNNWELLEQAVKIYSWPLNDIGPIDKMTILDYIYEDMKYYERNQPNSSTHKELMKVYNLYKESGAKHNKIKI